MPTYLEIKAELDSVLLAENIKAATIFVVSKNMRSYQCSVTGCSRSAYASGLCNAHYIRKRKGQSMVVPVRARKRGDLCETCGGKTGAKGGWGLCAKHYRRRRYVVLKTALVESFGGACSRCRGQFPIAVFDFHHLGNKEDAPSSMLLNASSASLAREVAKCVLLCANCHRIEHSECKF